MSQQRMRLELDPGVRRSTKGTVLTGGSPFRLIRLSDPGARVLDRWLSGDAVAASDGEQALAERLLDAAMVHPVIDPAPPAAGVGVVVPVYDDAPGLAELLPALRRELPHARIVVVDDASPDAWLIERVAARHEASLLRLPVNRGPGAARNRGWRALAASNCGEGVRTAVFIDSDVVPSAGWLDALCAHIEGGLAAAVAPRVRARPGASAVDRYEACESPLDMGVMPALVKPGSPVPYVPGAALAVTIEALREAGGFDETLRAGEDVDFVWRLAAAGGQVRYEPRSVVYHRNRPGLSELAQQRRSYGSAAAPLAERHPDDLAPVVAPASAVAAWGLAAFGRGPVRLLGPVLAAVEGARLYRRLDGRIGDPLNESVRLSALGQRQVGHWLARAVTRAWLPAALAASAVVPATRAGLLVAAVVPGIARWSTRRPALDPARFLALRLVDDAAYCFGVWQGALRARSARALLPRVKPWRAP